MEHLQIPLSDTEEAVLHLLRIVTKLEAENEQLRDEINRLKEELE
jgi:cell division protein FtsB